MVTPLLEMPASSAKIWALPTARALFGVMRVELADRRVTPSPSPDRFAAEQDQTVDREEDGGREGLGEKLAQLVLQHDAHDADGN